MASTPLKDPPALSDLSEKLGVAAEDLSRFQYAAQLSGSSGEGLATSLGFLNRSIDAASDRASEQADSFERLGISIADVGGKAKDTPTVLLDIAESFSRMKDGPAKTAIAMKLLGKSGAELIPLLNQGRAGLKQVTDEADRLGVTISTKTARAAGNFNDNLDRMKGAMTGVANKACADCHDNARISMKGVAARYPAFDTALGRPVDLEQRINSCRGNRQQATPLPFESRDLLALTAFVARQSHGVAIETGSDPQLAPFIARGRELFMQRQGQLNLGCANCHDDNWEKRLAGSAITQGHPTGYPLYRLEWQSLGSLQRRLRACMSGIRAQAYDYGAPELVDLELYLMSRARGMPMETPAVRP